MLQELDPLAPILSDPNSPWLLPALLLVGSFLYLLLQATRTMPFIPWITKFLLSFIGFLLVGTSTSDQIAQQWGILFFAVGLLAWTFVLYAGISDISHASSLRRARDD
jgi:hypothetical protein